MNHQDLVLPAFWGRTHSRPFSQLAAALMVRAIAGLYHLISHLYLCLHMALSYVAGCLKFPLLSFLFSSFS